MLETKQNMKYEFKSTGNKNVDSIIKQFDKQIKIEYKSAGGDKKKCPSYWDKLIFLKTLNLDINDWRKIRSGDFWLIRDSLQGIKQSQFIHERIVDYLSKPHTPPK